MYSHIQSKKAMGYSRDATARQLGLSWRTVDRYWEMTPEEYQELSKENHRCTLDRHESAIVGWLERFPDLSAAQVQDWLLEHYQETCSDRTVRHYVNRIRLVHDIPKPVKNTREYFVVPEMPPGQQMQADFGEYWALREDHRRIKLYFVVFILSHSRYKHVLWQTKPFTSAVFVQCLEDCFSAFGGMPQELVIDQDKLMIVSENSGDIIHTYEFERCKSRYGFTVWLCRKADPESKGMVESGVKFVKYNFAKNRCFRDIGQWSQACADWLERTGNGKKHEETKKIPAEVFALERLHLRPVPPAIHGKADETMVTTPVRKNNTIRYKSSRYSVPVGTYTMSKTALVREQDGTLEIYDFDGKRLAEHPLASEPGSLVRNRNHARNTTEGVMALVEEARAALGNTQEAEMFLSYLRKTKTRYIRDQLDIVTKTAREYGQEISRLAVKACLECREFSAKDFKDFSDFQFRQVTMDQVLVHEPIRTAVAAPRADIPNLQLVRKDPAYYSDKIVNGGK
jgi:transposase